jgi:hypothetical protein
MCVCTAVSYVHAKLSNYRWPHQDLCCSKNRDHKGSAQGEINKQFVDLTTARKALGPHGCREAIPVITCHRRS